MMVLYQSMVVQRGQVQDDSLVGGSLKGRSGYRLSLQDYKECHIELVSASTGQIMMTIFRFAVCSVSGLTYNNPMDEVAEIKQRLDVAGWLVLIFH